MAALDSQSKVSASGQWVHFVAIGGTGMGALAGLMKDLGYRVTGSDGPLYPPMSTFLSETKKIPVAFEYHAKNLQGSTWGFAEAHPHLVVVGNAISRGHVEAAVVETLVAQNKCRRLSFAQGLAEFAIADNRSFVVVGTHGKTTTTSLMTWCFEVLGKNPGFFIGGIPKNFGLGCRVSAPSHAKGYAQERGVFVSEGDEYDTAYWDKESKFLHYRPSWVLCTSIELDHVDIFKGIEDVELAFVKLAAKIREGMLLIDDQSAPRASSLQPLLAAMKEKNLPVLRYGWQENSDYQLLLVEAVPLPWNSTVVGSKIKVRCRGQGVVEFCSPMIGAHNALNVVGILGTLLESQELKSAQDIEKLLKDFGGIKRRQEEFFVDPKLVIIDDFAHHPTAIRETLLALKARYRGTLMSAFFEPRSATSARNALSAEFEEAFLEADAVFLTPPTKVNIPENEKLNVEALATAIRKKAPEKFIFIHKDVDELTRAFGDWMTQNPNTRHVAAVMTNGPFGALHKKLEDSFLSKKKILGQAAIEYILLSAMMVGVILGVMYPVIKRHIDTAQKTLADNTTTTISQDELGIPIAWFQGGTSFVDASKVDNAGDSFQPTGGGSGGDGPSGNDGNQGPSNTGGGTDPSTNTDPGAGTGGGGTGGNISNSTNQSGGSTGGSTATEDEKSKDANSPGSKTEFDDTRNSSTAGTGGAGGDVSDTSEADKEKDKDGSGGDLGADDKSGDSRKRRDVLGQDAESQGGGTCSGMNMLTLLKLGIAIAIFLLGAAVLVTTKGQKGK